jgi:hypothetical protein
MSTCIRSGLLTCIGAAALFLGPASVAEAKPESGNTLSIAVSPMLKDVSLSRPDKPVTASFNITIGNNSPNNNYVYDFKVTGTVAPAGAAQFFSAYGISCTGPNGTSPADQAVVFCSSTESLVGKSFLVTFKSPMLVAPLPTRLTVTVEPTSNAIKGSGSDFVNLITTTDIQNNTEFYSTVTTVGGIFFTGSKASATNAPPPIGGAPKVGARVTPTTDPQTTTVVIPNITNPTYATATERTPTSTTPSDCPTFLPALSFVTCYDVDITIPNLAYPSTNEKKYVTMYFRLDYTSLGRAPSVGILNIPFYYRHTANEAFSPVPWCYEDSSLPKAGQPCKNSARIYPGDNSVNSDLWYDWEWEIFSVDNGRWIF